MSVITSAGFTYAATTGTFGENSQSNRAAPAPQRETELARQLETRLTGELFRIRQQINSGGAGFTSSDGLGQRVDIRA